ncbi:MAG TPA: segregation/condensation protein A [Candidatus Limnocylindrales bacterium]
MPTLGPSRRIGAVATTRRDVLPSRLGAAPKVELSDVVGETATHIRLEDFDGPIALLLALIEARQLDVLTVPLGGLAEAYLDALAALDGDRLGNVSSFVAVAAQLILLKSRAILPRPPTPSAIALDDEADPEAELRARLIEYRRYRDAGQVLAARIDAGRLFRRDADLAASAGRAFARPPERPPLAPAELAAALDGLAILIPQMEPPTELMGRMVTLSERAAIIRAALLNADCIVLQDLLSGVRDRVVVAVTFLAMLELSKRREISLEQKEPWGPILVRRLTGALETPAEVDESLGSFA